MIELDDQCLAFGKGGDRGDQPVAFAAVGQAGITLPQGVALVTSGPAGMAALGSLLVPVIGVSSSGALLGEPLGWRHLAALVLTLGGVILASRG